ncbi:MAG: transcriptional regulator [Deltaproteobacteria bacterium HGW-Deltaproteobacteria-6]|jgi:ArsR family transcriptional regulator|nr:MAG: transcriptional regulator [Deltaproteobacteria bacterium HGW-Deltaproteobacteria-6]
MKREKKNKEDVCEILCINDRKVAAARKAMKSDATLFKLAAIFKVLGDPTRTKIISALLQEELCVCDLSTLIGTSQSAISHQLRVLRNMDLVKYRKDGRIAYYSLDDDHISSILTAGLKHVEE